MNGAVQIGAASPGVGGTVTKLKMTGGGALVHNGSSFLVGGHTGTVSAFTTLDLTGLASATFTTTGNFRVAPNTNNNNGGGGTLLLPTPAVADTVATTTITSSGSYGIGVGVGGANNGSSTVTPPQNTLQLGTGLTRLNAANILVGSEAAGATLRDSGRIIYGQSAGDLIIRAADGISRATSIQLNYRNAAGATGSLFDEILFDVSGHDADILVDTIRLGGGFIRTDGGDTRFKFGAGDQVSMASVLDATSVNIGNRSAGQSATSTQNYSVDLSGGTATFGNAGATGTGVDIGNSAYDQAGAATFNSQLNISGGNVTIHNGTGGFAVRLGQSTAANGGTVNASMNLAGGITTLTGDIVRGMAAGTVTSTLLLSGGSLDMGGNDIGTATEPVSLTAESGTLSNVATINGSGGLTKTTAGTLTLSGTIAYAGDTTVSAGTLTISSAASPADANTSNNASTVTIAASGATLNLTYTGTDIVGKLFFGSTQQPAGTYSASSVPAGATITTASFSGSGSLTVTTSPSGYSSWQAAQNGGAGTTQTIGQDHDNDSVTNGVEFFLGGNTDTTGFTPLPPVVKDPITGILSITWPRHPGYPGFPGNYGTDFVVETSTTLAGPWTPEAPLGTNVTISGNNVTYTFPGGPAYTGKNFARLKVTGP